MCFYLEPSSGKIDLSLLQKCAERRLEFLIKIRQADVTEKEDKYEVDQFIYQTFGASDSDFLIEGTKKDVISHFLLRLALCDENDTSDFMIKAETSLFAFRFLCMNEDEMYRCFKRIDTTVKRLSYNIFPSGPSLCYFNKLADVLQSILNSQKSWKKIAKLYLQGCENESFLVPFTSALNLVSKRFVTLQRGIASVPFCKLKEVMKELFIYHLHYGFKHAKIQRQKIIRSDDRMRRLFLSLKIKLRQKYKSNWEYSRMISNISHDQVYSEVEQFPPCMFHLHQRLQTKHRLKHHSRIQYTLFLKDIGMSVHDAVWFWKKEYNKVPENTTGCQHAWKNNEHRYIYNMRHLYGLEGSCINYKGHCCTSLQSLMQLPGENGGCPFKHFDEANLKDLLQTSDDRDLEQKILDLKDGGYYSSACQIFLEKRMQNVKKNIGPGTSYIKSSTDGHQSVKITRYNNCQRAEENTNINSIQDDVEMDKNLHDQYENLHACVNKSSLVGQKRKMSETNHKYSQYNAHILCKQTLHSADGNKQICSEYIKSKNEVAIKNSSTFMNTHNTVSEEKMDFISMTKCTDEGSVLPKDTSDVSPSFNCYDHELCPSQFCQAKRKTITVENEVDLVNTTKLSKPADFYFSLKKLTDGLKSSK